MPFRTHLFTAARHVGMFLLTWLPVFVCIAVIFSESKQGMGSAYTSRFLRPLWMRYFGPISDARWYELHHVIRKFGHFFGYGLTGLAWRWGWDRIERLPHTSRRPWQRRP